MNPVVQKRHRRVVFSDHHAQLANLSCQGELDVGPAVEATGKPGSKIEEVHDQTILAPQRVKRARNLIR